MNDPHPKPGLLPKRRLFMLLACAGAFGASVLAGMWLSMSIDERERLLHPSRAVFKEPANRSLSGSYLAGQFAASNHDFTAGADYALHAVQEDPDSMPLKYQALRLLVAAGRMDEAAPIASAMLEADSDDSLAVMVELNRRVSGQEYKAARRLLKKPLANGIFGLLQPVLDQWVVLGEEIKNQEQSDPVNMKEIIDNAGFLAPFVHYQQALMNDLAGFEKSAANDYRHATENKQVVPYRVVQAASNFYLRRGDTKKAKQLFDDYAKNHPDSELIPSAVPDIDKPKEAIAPLINSVDSGLAEIYFTAASLLFGEQASQESLIYVRLALGLRPDFPPAQMMLANLLEQYEAYLEAIKVYESIDPASIFYQKGLVRIALNYRAAKQDDQAITLLERLIQQDPASHEAAMMLGDIYRQREQYGKAIMVYDKAIQALSATGKPDWDSFYKRGIAYERNGNWQRAEEDLKKALELEPDQPDVLNYLGYSWLEHGVNIDKAAEVIAKAYELQPDEAHIIDSMGWLLYQQGQYDKAVEYLENALDLAPQDATLNEHMGDAYWRVGRRIEARFQWDRALAYDPEKPEAIKQKIRDGLPAVAAPKPDVTGEGTAASQ